MTLREGYQMLTNIIGVTADELRVGPRGTSPVLFSEPGFDAAVLHQGLMVPRTGDLPTTAYLVLGVLAANDEQLTAGKSNSAPSSRSDTSTGRRR